MAVSGSFTIYGKTSASEDGTGSASTQSTSLLSANSGDLTLRAGLDEATRGTGAGNITTQGADLLAGETMTLSGRAIDLQAVRNETSSHSVAESSSLTVGAALAGPLGSKITAIGDAIGQSQHTDNSRLQDALVLKAGYDAYKLTQGKDVTSVDATGTTEATTQAAQVAKAAQIAKARDMAGGAGAASASSGIGVSVSIGSSKSSSESSTHDTQVIGTNLQARDIVISASETDLRMAAAKLQAETIALSAKRDVILEAVANTSELSSSNKGSSVGGGVTFAFGGEQNGLSFQLNASRSQGKADGKETTWDNTQITATDKLSVTSGRDTTLKGAQVSGGTVIFDVGGKLLIETLQDSSKYDSTQSSSGFSVSVCWFFCVGAPVTGSLSASEQSIKHSYLSAVGQSGIAAGDGGFDIRVKGATELVGAAITSSAAAGDNRLTTASLSSRDLQNAQSTQSQSSSISVGYSGASMLTTLAGNAALPQNGSQSGTTQSVISPATVTITGSDDAAKDEQSRQTAEQLTARDAASANGSLTNTLTLQQAQALPDQIRRQQENMEAAKLVGAVLSNMVGDLAKDKWSDGSPQKIALHGMVGLIEAKIGGGSAAAGALAGMTHEALVPAMTTYLNSLGFDESTPAKKLEFDALMNAGSSLLGAAVGALASGDVKGASTGASVALIADINNRALHQDRKLQVARAVAAKTGEKVDTDQIKSRMLFDGEAAALVDGGTYDAMSFNPELIAAGASTGAADSVALASAFKGDVGRNGAVFVASPQDSPEVRYQTAVQFLGPYFETWLNAPGNEANKDSFTARIVDTPSGLVNLTDFYHVAEAISIEKKSQQAGFSGGATTFFDKLGQGVSNMFNFAAKYREASILNACTECPQSMQDKPNNLFFAADLLLTASILKDVAVLGGRGVLALKGAKGTTGLDRLVPEGEFASGLNQPASSVNAADALARKLSALQEAQQSAVRTSVLEDGRILYYSAEIPARTTGPTRGASLVTEYDSITGGVRQYYESYNQAGNAIRVHPKMIDGQVVTSPHFPPTGKELGK